jgi:transposase
VEQAAQKILEQAQAQRWVQVTVEPGEEAVYRQAGPGRPGKNTQYRRQMRPKPRLTWKMREDAIAWDAKTDGLFPLITTEKEATKKQILLWYKYQPRLEKRFEQLKTVMEVRPVCLKSVERVEAYLLLYYIALIVETLMERQLRGQMKAQGIPMLPLYPEKRMCKAPTAERVLELFSNVRRHRLIVGEREDRRFHDELTPLQRRVLRLLGVPTADYRN